MPTYEYKCRKCGYDFEEFQNITDPPLKRCPICKGRVDRLIGAGAGILFKGPGFYATDYRSSEYRNREKQDLAPAAGDTKTAERSETGGEATERSTTRKVESPADRAKGSKRKTRKK
ncbi:hypothetical protein AMJ71_10460 [candidate division TA06 bacterium SM1_40]|uniref:Putative regulatory protein FmdB zinc ribbon domain-containing protein n=2 Tax=Bacteria division TA06 TaxID=1156500 RepID=A0A0S8J831_UNCT6|nr:MAG: hypothetical protein AMJ82_09435 [candidate division TA06 bacterium SM23_40]KPL05913.1 MAG: hypothetical protein AMJ71_10460 [candidate division TA06 bacterium SM1_40]